MSRLGAQGAIHRATSRKLYKKIYKENPPNVNKNELRCICLNARGIINKRSDLDFMIADIEHDVMGIRESWPHKDMVDTM